MPRKYASPEERDEARKKSMRSAQLRFLAKRASQTPLQKREGDDVYTGEEREILERLRASMQETDRLARALRDSVLLRRPELSEFLEEGFTRLELCNH